MEEKEKFIKSGFVRPWINGLKTSFGCAKAMLVKHIIHTSKLQVNSNVGDKAQSFTNLQFCKAFFFIIFFFEF